MTTELTELHDDWLNAVWDELLKALDRQHLDASHDVASDVHDYEAAGPRAYLDGLYTDDGTRRTYDDPVMDRMSRASEEAAIIYANALEDDAR